MRLADLKALVQEHYTEHLAWADEHYYGGCSYAEVDHHTVCVMVEPPKGQPHICRVIGRRQEPLDEWLVEQLELWTA